ncbi:hypothetical protein G3I32_21730, partial [Streptomyces coelicoflavus]|nr:hypothetical protein [Streptomyces coelicoflavus]
MTTTGTRTTGRPTIGTTTGTTGRSTTETTAGTTAGTTTGPSTVAVPEPRNAWFRRGRHRRPRPRKVLLVAGGLALAAGALGLVRLL